MESEREQILAQLRESDRGEAAPWLSWEPPRWHSAFFAAWTFVFVAHRGLGDNHVLGSTPVLLALTVVAGALLWAQRRSVGVYPTGPMPRELRRPMAGWMAVYVAVLATAWTLTAVAPWWLVALGGAAATYAALEAYRRSYHRAAQRAGARIDGTVGATR